MKPFIKWVGGKSSLLPSMELPPSPHYVEPFVGGGAVLWARTFEGAYISDANSDLVGVYRDVRDRCDELACELRALSCEDYRETFYARRDEFNSIGGGLRKSALFIFLNKTCFNGLYRVNARGLLNSPCGRYNNPVVCDESNLRACSEHLQNVEIGCGSFEESLGYVRADSFVYCDPPYRGTFTSYTSGGFDDGMQRKLAEYAREVDSRGAKILLSNSDLGEGFLEDLYEGFRIKRVYAKRSISADGSKREKAPELLISNY